jgi:acyl-CoA hydrolase
MTSQFHAPPTVMVEMIFPDQANHYGTLFGGNGLALMAKAAAVAAMRRAQSAVVLARLERADFISPIHVGELLELSAGVTRTGRSSMTVEVLGMAEGMPAGERREVLSGRFEMVAVDDAGRPRAIAGNTARRETNENA